MIVAKWFKINTHRPKPFLGCMITTVLFLNYSLVIWEVNHLNTVIEDLTCDDLILGGLTQKGKGTSVGASSPWPDPSSPFTYIVYITIWTLYIWPWFSFQRHSFHPGPRTMITKSFLKPQRRSSGQNRPLNEAKL